MAANVVRGWVSLKKKRYQESGFDLDLTYITPRIIAMGYPSTGFEGVYRNPMPEVQRFFEAKHKGHFKVYNLCMERQYDLTGYFDLVEWFPFNDHNAPPLEMIKLFCDSVDKYLAEDPQNVVAVHCKAGKGRTGCVCAAYLQHSGVTETAQEALDFFGRERTHNCKGVTIPSQKRYVYYYGAMLQSKLLHVPAKTYHVQHIRFVTVPLSSHGVDPWFEVFFWQKVGDCEWEEKKIYNYCNFAKVKHYNSSTDFFVDLDCSAHNLKIRGDVRLQFYNSTEDGKAKKLFHVWLSTAFIEKNYMCFEKGVIDKVNKDKHHKKVDANFKIELFVVNVPDEEIEGTAVDADADGEANSEVEELEEDEDD